jgi:hypothetical protein
MMHIQGFWLAVAPASPMAFRSIRQRPDVKSGDRVHAKLDDLRQSARVFGLAVRRAYSAIRSHARFRGRLRTVISAR